MPVIANLEPPTEYVKKTAYCTPAGAIFGEEKNDRTFNKTLFPSLLVNKEMARRATHCTP